MFFGILKGGLIPAFLTGIQSPDFADLEVDVVGGSSCCWETGLWEGFWVVVGVAVVAAEGGRMLVFTEEGADSSSLFLFIDFLASVSISSGKKTSFVTMSSSSPMVAAAAVSAWPMAVLVRTCWLKLSILVGGIDVVCVLPA